MSSAARRSVVLPELRSALVGVADGLPARDAEPVLPQLRRALVAAADGLAAPARELERRRAARRRAIRLAAPVPVTAAVVVALVLAAGPSDEAPTIRPVDHGLPSGPPAEHLAVLRGPAPPEVPRYERSLLEGAGVPADSARSVDLGGGRPTWVAASGRTLCVLAPQTFRGAAAGSAIGCSEVPGALVQGTAVSTAGDDPGRADVTVAVPDGIDAVAVSEPGAAPRTVPVRRNLARATVASGGTVSVRGTDGRRHVLD